MNLQGTFKTKNKAPLEEKEIQNWLLERHISLPKKPSESNQSRYRTRPHAKNREEKHSSRGNKINEDVECVKSPVGETKI